MMQPEKKKKSSKTIFLPAIKPGKKNGKNEFGLLLNFTARNKFPFAVEKIMVQTFNGERYYKTLPLINDKSLLEFGNLPEAVIFSLGKLAQEKINLILLESEFFPGSDQRIYDNLYTNLERKLLLHFNTCFKELKPFSSILKWYFTFADDLNTIQTKPATFSSFTPTLSFELRRSPKGFLQMQVKIHINGQNFSLQDFKRHTFLLQSRNEFFLLSLNDMEELDKYPKGYIEIKPNNEAEFILKTIGPLSEKYNVERDILLDEAIDDVVFQPRVYLGELNNSFLMITIKWLYGETVFDDEPGDMFHSFADGKPMLIKRNTNAENEIKKFVSSTHERFPKQKNGYYYLSFAEAEKKQWFVKFYRNLIDKDIPVYGMEELKHFRYNPNVPVIQVHYNGKSIDWFDLKVKINFGDQQVELADLQKAFYNKQPFILLKDGTIGAIPEEWALEYSMLFRLGKLKDDSIRLSAFHHTLLDNMKDGGAISAKVITQGYKEKWQSLQQQKDRLYQVPAEIKATLRDYQVAGFEWLCLLDEMQWGACLADDMGLGKTLQIICFLQHACLQKKDETHLVVCPTSLLYNWENELKKFAPELSYFIYYNNNRNFDPDTFRKHNIVLTTYGCIRSDIELLEQFNFGYIVCDESHYIKNPAALLSKAIVRLQSRNRIALSGTPVQNNTFDLYTQMNFINPGLLGNREFFKTEFSQPIDKLGDKEKSAQLKKIIYPFMLRRTKEQVAKDLPAKTEITLWCEMEEEQKKIYDTIKNYYRQSILQRIEKSGIGKNTVHILEGLTKLRQACNAPQLIKDYTGSSCTPVKLELLLNELEENTGNHKVIVFSQFTGMLQLIGDALEKDNMPYLYLDGTTKAEQRQSLVQQFQTTDETRIFLVSLKAGGVGLTLTAADYVYLVDPWWNPAAEQQAIDRTHRIGQQQKVFAYKMICRDTVEEKILALQQKKQSLVKDIISEETGFIKSLSEDDVKYLFG